MPDDLDSNSPKADRSTAAADAVWWAQQLGQAPTETAPPDHADASERDEMLYTRDRVDRKTVEEKLVAAETNRREVQAQLQKKAARLAELEEEQEVVLGEAKLAERFAADLEEHLERLRQELAAVEVAEAQEAVQDALRGRDAAVANAAAAAAELAAAIETIASARQEVQEAHQRLRTLDPNAPAALRSETDKFDEQWRPLAPMVEAELGVQLESQLVEAAARTSNPLVMESLPEHLRELVRQRKRALVQRRRERLDGAPNDRPAKPPDASRR